MFDCPQIFTSLSLDTYLEQALGTTSSKLSFFASSKVFCIIFLGIHQ